MQKERYHSLSSTIGSKIKMREIPNNSKITYDTFIFLKITKKRNKIIKILNKEKFGIKIYLMQLSGTVHHIGIML